MAPPLPLFLPHPPLHANPQRRAASSFQLPPRFARMQGQAAPACELARSHAHARTHARTQKHALLHPGHAGGRLLAQARCGGSPVRALQPAQQRSAHARVQLQGQVHGLVTAQQARSAAACAAAGPGSDRRTTFKGMDAMTGGWGQQAGANAACLDEPAGNWRLGRIWAHNCSGPCTLSPALLARLPTPPPHSPPAASHTPRSSRLLRQPCLTPPPPGPHATAPHHTTLRRPPPIPAARPTSAAHCHGHDACAAAA